MQQRCTAPVLHRSCPLRVILWSTPRFAGQSLSLSEALIPIAHLPSRRDLPSRLALHRSCLVAPHLLNTERHGKAVRSLQPSRKTAELYSLLALQEDFALPVGLHALTHSLRRLFKGLMLAGGWRHHAVRKQIQHLLQLILASPKCKSLLQPASQLAHCRAAEQACKKTLLTVQYLTGLLLPDESNLLF